MKWINQQHLFNFVHQLLDTSPFVLDTFVINTRRSWAPHMSEWDCLLNATCNNISIICDGTQMCRRTEEVGPALGLLTPYIYIMYVSTMFPICWPIVQGGYLCFSICKKKKKKNTHTHKLVRGQSVLAVDEVRPNTVQRFNRRSRTCEKLKGSLTCPSKHGHGPNLFTYYVREYNVPHLLTDRSGRLSLFLNLQKKKKKILTHTNLFEDNQYLPSMKLDQIPFSGSIGEVEHVKS